MTLWDRIAMAFLPAAIRERRDALVISPKHPGDPALAEMFGVRDSGSGINVTERTAISWTGLASGIRLAAETVGMLPIDVVRRDGRKRLPMPEHPVAQVLRFPNPETSWMEFREVMQTQMELWGTCYAQIVRDGARRPIELWQLPSDRVTVERSPRGGLQYRVGLPNDPFGASVASTVLPADEVLHIRGWSTGGILGTRIAVQFKEAIGLGLATEYFGASLFGSGANPGGFLEHPGQLTVDAQDRLITQKEKQIAGIGRAHRIMILEEGMKWQQMTIEPEKAQFLGTRTFQIGEAARMIRIPPHVLYELSRATFSNIEHQGIELVIYSWLPRTTRWEARLAMQLLGPKDFANTQIKFNMAGLLRGDLASQGQFFKTMRDIGVFSPNDILELMDRSPREGGDIYVDMPAGTPPQNPPAPKGNAQPAGDGEAVRALTELKQRLLASEEA